MLTCINQQRSQQKKQYEYQKAEFYADSKSVEMIVEKVFFKLRTKTMRNFVKV